MFLYFIGIFQTNADLFYYITFLFQSFFSHLQFSWILDNYISQIIFYYSYVSVFLYRMDIHPIKNILLFWYLGSNTKHATLYTFCNIASVLFRFIIAHLFLYIVVLLLFRFFYFWRCNKVWVQFFSAKRVLQDIGLRLYIHCVTISNKPPFPPILLLCFSIKLDFSFYIT